MAIADRVGHESVDITYRYAHLFPSKQIEMVNTLYDYFLQLNRDAKETFSELVKRMAVQEGVTEKLKSDNQMEWVARMNNIHSRATEIVNHDIIYN